MPKRTERVASFDFQGVLPPPPDQEARVPARPQKGSLPPEEKLKDLSMGAVCFETQLLLLTPFAKNYTCLLQPRLPPGGRGSPYTHTHTPGGATAGLSTWRPFGENFCFSRPLSGQLLHSEALFGSGQRSPFRLTLPQAKPLSGTPEMSAHPGPL